MEENKDIETKETETETKTYTEDEVLAMIQSEADKRVAQALKTQQKKYEKQLSLASMDEEARAKAESEDKIKELEERVAQMTIEKNRSELKSVLSSRGLSAEFADILNITDDIEASQAVIEKLDKLFKEAVKKEVKDKLLSVGGTPKGDGTSSGVADTKEKFLALPASEMQRLLDERPDFYSKFLN